MKRIHVLSLVIVAVIFSGCATANEPTGVWVNTEKFQGKSFHNVFIVVMTADVEARSVLENDLAAAAVAKGYKAVKSMDVLAPTFSDPKAPSREEVVGKVKESGCDAVLVSTLLKKEDAVRYTPGTTTYAPMATYSYYGNYYGYYSNYYQTVATNEYYAQDKSYFMQSNLYDAASEEIVWSVQSKIFNPSSLKSFSKTYTTTLIKQLEKEKAQTKKKKS